MKFIEFTLRNYKSLKDVTIPVQSYGVGTSESNTTILVGLNESGKSAIIEAICLLNNGMEDVDYNEDCYLEAQEDDQYIDLYATMEPIDNNFWKNEIKEKLKLDKEFVKDLVLQSIERNVYKNFKDGAKLIYFVKVNEDLPFYRYIVNSLDQILLLADVNGIKEKITIENAPSFLKEGQKLLDQDTFERTIAAVLEPIFNRHIPVIKIWKPDPSYLINEEIDLNIFKNDPTISVPLRNIFNIYGKKSSDEIKKCIDKALSNQARCDELEAKMSEKVTKHINQIWTEHQINIRISINGSKCQVLVEDKDKEFAYYTMSQRSAGFKQFISLILSLSAQNESKTLKNTMILIDEPEVHLHPSGIRYMRDELLKIGKSNIVFISTHSHYMVDTSVPERHWIIQKHKSETEVMQLKQTKNIADDSVLSQAFGLNLFRELLPNIIILVEGEDDKNIISHSLGLLKSGLLLSIKSAGGASKISGFARLLMDEKIKATILLDADKEGKDCKKLILQSMSKAYSQLNLFTLKDLHNGIPNDSTIEDLLPIDFVKEFFEKELRQDFNLISEKAVLIQLKNQSETLKSDKQKLDSLKYKLSKEFCNRFDEIGHIESMERLYFVINELNQKLLISKEILRLPSILS